MDFYAILGISMLWGGFLCNYIGFHDSGLISPYHILINSEAAARRWNTDEGEIRLRYLIVYFNSIPHVTGEGEIN